MDDTYDVPDSTDWLDTPLSHFAELESTLHCQICKEFYDTPMITSCNHTFCSKCIRTSLSGDGKCPVCRASDQTSKLRSNWALQEVVVSFLAARSPALAVARKAQEPASAPVRSGKRKRAILDSDDIAEVKAETFERTTRSKSRKIATTPQGSQREEVIIADSEDEATSTESEPQVRVQADDGLVECPLGCGKRMKEEAVFGHLDRCEDEQKLAAKAKLRRPLDRWGTPKTASVSGAKPQDRINELNYSMMTESALSKKLREQGISAQGPKQLMINRHKEWVNIWNANCDSLQPRTKRELLHDLDAWERTQGSRAPVSHGLGSALMRKDFDGEAYAKKHQDEFSRLIADARRKKHNTMTETDRREYKVPPAGTGGSDGDDTGVSFVGETDHASPSKESASTVPHANSPKAIAPIRQKVQVVNEGEEFAPVLNEGFKITTEEGLLEDLSGVKSSGTTAKRKEDMSNGVSLDIAPSTTADGDFSPTQLRPGHSLERRKGSMDDEHYAHTRTGSPSDMPAHLHSSQLKKVPMFAVPKHAVTDVDSSGAALQ